MKASWSDITLKEYAALEQLAREVTDAPNSRLTQIACIKQTIDSLVILEGKPREVVENYTRREGIDRLAKFDWIKERVEAEPVSEIEIGGRRFKVIYDANEGKARHLIDCLEYLNSVNRDDVPQHEIYAPIIAVVLEPIDHVKEDIGKLVAFIEDRLTMDQVFPIIDFFLLLYPRLLKATETYLDRKQRETLKELQTVLKDVGDGSALSTASQIQTQLNGEK